MAVGAHIDSYGFAHFIRQLIHFQQSELLLLLPNNIHLRLLWKRERKGDQAWQMILNVDLFYMTNASPKFIKQNIF